MCMRAHASMCVIIRHNPQRTSIPLSLVNVSASHLHSVISSPSLTVTVISPLSQVDDVCHHLDREQESANGSLSRRFSAQVIRRAPLPAMYVTLFLIHTFPRKPPLIHRRLPILHLWRHDLIPHDIIRLWRPRWKMWLTGNQCPDVTTYLRAAETRHDVIDRVQWLTGCRDGWGATKWRIQIFFSFLNIWLIFKVTSTWHNMRNTIFFLNIKMRPHIKN